MENYRPIAAIVGSVRNDILGAKETLGRQACEALGGSLAQAGWRIAVFSSDPDDIEADVVKGYIAAGGTAPASIVCYFPRGRTLKFPEEQNYPDAFFRKLDTSVDWKVSFYRTISIVDGIVLVGGANSTKIAGQMALSRDLPIIALEHFGGAGLEVWQSLASKPAFIQDQDLEAMSEWTSKSAERCAASLNGQYERRKKKTQAAEEAVGGLRDKAAKWDEHVVKEADNKARATLTIIFLVLFVLSVLMGFIGTIPGVFYTVVAILGLCFAGGFGATVRMISPGAPATRKLISALLGITVGLVFSLLYMLPQLVGGKGFPLPSEVGITPADRVQFLTALLVAFMAGLGFDYAMEQLLRRAKDRGDEIINAGTAGVIKPPASGEVEG